MSQISLDNLCNDMLLEIFNYLDPKSLKNCCETSQRFNQIIGSNASTMKRLPLFIDSMKIQEKHDEIKILSRNYHTLIFDGISIGQNLIKSLIDTDVLSNVKALELINVHIIPTALLSLLKTLTKLEKILFAESEIDGFKKRMLVDIPSLRSIVLMESSFQFFEFIGKNGIQELKLHHSKYGTKNDNDDEIFEEFLMRAGSLREISVRVHPGTIYKRLLRFEYNEYNFKIRKMLVAYLHFGLGTSADDDFLEFLKQHEDTMEHLEIDCKLTEETYEYIFSTMKLKSLRIDGSPLPKSPLFYNSIMPNNHLKKLVVTKAFNDQSQQAMLKIYKSISDLNFFQWTAEISNEILISIANNLSHLTTLSIPDIPDNHPEIPMSSLQSLHIESVRNAANFQSFVSLHTNIKKLSMKWIHIELGHDVINAVTSRLSHLEVLTFGPFFKPFLRLYETIKRNSPNLKIIQIFRFPDDAVDVRIESDNEVKTQYFTNKSSSLYFKYDSGMFDEEDMLFHFSLDDLEASEDNTGLDRYDVLTEEEDSNDSNEDEDIDMEDMYHGAYGMHGFVMFPYY